MTGIKDITGGVFGRLAVVSLSHIGPNRHSHWKCSCECGGEITVGRSALTGGKTKSCGCLQRESQAKNRKNAIKHGMSGSAEYVTWRSMMDRCANVNNPRYGGRGIKVCERWLNSFDDFYADMGGRPVGTSLDRKDNNGNYEPDNCRWATSEEQANNRSNNIKFDFYGKPLSIKETAGKLKIGEDRLRYLVKQGLKIEKVVQIISTSK